MKRKLLATMIAVFALVGVMTVSVGAVDVTEVTNLTLAIAGVESDYPGVLYAGWTINSDADNISSPSVALLCSEDGVGDISLWASQTDTLGTGTDAPASPLMKWYSDTTVTTKTADTLRVGYYYNDDNWPTQVISVDLTIKYVVSAEEKYSLDYAGSNASDTYYTLNFGEDTIPMFALDGEGTGNYNYIYTDTTTCIYDYDGYDYDDIEEDTDYYVVVYTATEDNDAYTLTLTKYPLTVNFEGDSSGDPAVTPSDGTITDMALVAQDWTTQPALQWKGGSEGDYALIGYVCDGVDYMSYTYLSTADEDGYYTNGISLPVMGSYTAIKLHIVSAADAAEISSWSAWETYYNALLDSDFTILAVDVTAASVSDDTAITLTQGETTGSSAAFNSQTGVFSSAGEYTFVASLGGTSQYIGIVSNEDGSVTLYDWSYDNGATWVRGIGGGTNGFSEHTLSIEGDVVAWGGTANTFTITTTVYSDVTLVLTASTPTSYTITKAAATDGSFTVTAVTAAEGTEITITPTANSGYQLDTITVTGDTTSTGVAVTDNKFTMPAEDVTVTVTFVAIPATPLTATAADFSIASGIYYVGDSLTGVVSSETVTSFTVDAIDTATAGVKTITVDIAGDSDYEDADDLVIGTITVYNKMVPAVAVTTDSDPIDTALLNTGLYTVASPVAVADVANSYTVAITGTATLSSYANYYDVTGTWIGLLVSASMNGDDATIDNLYWSADGSSWSALTGEAAAAADDGGDSSTQMAFWMDTADTSVTRYLATDNAGADMLTITFNFTAYTTSSGGSGGSGGSGSSTTITTETSDDGSATVTVTPTTSTSSGTTSATVTDSNINTAVSNALSAVEDGASATVEIQVATKTSTTAISVSLTADALATVAESDVETVSITSDIGTVALPSEAIAAVVDQAETTTMTIAIAQVDTAETLTESQQALVGDAPVYDFTIQSGGETISTFGGHAVAVTLPYELKDGESAQNIVVWYISDAGEIIPMETVYDEDTGSVTFYTTHFSIYTIVHDANPFLDVDVSSWYYDFVLSAYEAGIMAGQSETSFGPDVATTRGMIATMLWSLEGKADWGICYPYADVEPDLWYTDGIYWCTVNRIVTGYTDETFRPDTAITREQLAVMLYAFAQYQGKDVSVGEDTNILSYTDAFDISDYAYEALQWACGAGIMDGTATGALNPQGEATRAQVATMMVAYLDM